MTNDADREATDPPVIEVISGNPSDEEIAAVVMVLSATSGGGDGGGGQSSAGPASAASTNGWSEYWLQVRGSQPFDHRGADAWRHSFR